MFLLSGLWVFYSWTITIPQDQQETVSQSSIRKKENDQGTSIVLPLQLYDPSFFADLFFFSVFQRVKSSQQTPKEKEVTSYPQSTKATPS